MILDFDPHNPSILTPPVRKFIGFWGSTRDEVWIRPGQPELKMPWPEDFIDTEWKASEAVTVGLYLQKGVTVETYLGLSQCRICGMANGCSEKSDGVYQWPEGFAHYVLAHAVKPPIEFIAHVKRPYR